jgi:hypothetical protein
MCREDGAPPATLGGATTSKQPELLLGIALQNTAPKYIFF